jgi:YVTN family beta-propeller protein
MAYNPDKGYIYVANQASESVSVIEVSSNNAIDSITVETSPSDVAYNRDNGYVYVTNFSSNTVSVIDSRTNEVIDAVKLIDGVGPHGVAYNPSNMNVYVSNFGNYGGESFSNIVSVIGSITPISDAGPNQNVGPGTKVNLDGSGSSDPRNQTLTYQWTQTAGPEVTLSDPRAENPTFNAPDTLLPQRLVFELVVTNEDGVESEPDDVTITINPVIPPPTPPEPPIEGIIGSGNNINIQAQENTGNNAVGQSDDGDHIHSDESIFQGQSTNQDSQVIS